MKKSFVEALSIPEKVFSKGCFQNLNWRIWIRLCDSFEIGDCCVSACNFLAKTVDKVRVNCSDDRPHAVDFLSSLLRFIDTSLS